jgi:hypothetical protein
VNDGTHTVTTGSQGAGSGTRAIPFVWASDFIGRVDRLTQLVVTARSTETSIHFPICSPRNASVFSKVIKLFIGAVVTNGFYVQI